MGRLDGRVAVINGGAQGIGRGIALRFAREGSAVSIVDTDDTQGQQTLNALAAIAANGEFIHADVGVKAEAQRAIAETVSRLGRVDILVNAIENHAPPAPTETMSDEAFAGTIGKTFDGTRWSMQAVFPHMRSQGGGHILSIVSIYGDSVWRCLGDYNAASEAVKALTRTAAEEWGQYGILVNAILPAADTASYQVHRARRPEQADQLVNNSPLGRMGDAERDIGGSAMFLVTDSGRFITGHMIYADGGQHLTPSPYEALIGCR